MRQNIFIVPINFAIRKMIKIYLESYPEDKKIYEYMNKVLNLSLSELLEYYNIDESTVEFLRSLYKYRTNKNVRLNLYEHIKLNIKSFSRYEKLAYGLIIRNTEYDRIDWELVRRSLEDVFFLQLIYDRDLGFNFQILFYLYKNNIKKINKILQNMDTRISYIILSICFEKGIELETDTIKNVVSHIQTPDMFLGIYDNLKNEESRLDLLSSFFVLNDDIDIKYEILQKKEDFEIDPNEFIKKIVLKCQDKYIENFELKYMKRCFDILNILNYKIISNIQKIKMAWMRIFLKYSKEKLLYQGLLMNTLENSSLNFDISNELAIHKILHAISCENKSQDILKNELTKIIRAYNEDNEFSIITLKSIFDLKNY